MAREICYEEDDGCVGELGDPFSALAALDADVEEAEREVGCRDAVFGRAADAVMGLQYVCFCGRVGCGGESFDVREGAGVVSLVIRLVRLGLTIWLKLSTAVRLRTRRLL